MVTQTRARQAQMRNIVNDCMRIVAEMPEHLGITVVNRRLHSEPRSMSDIGIFRQLPTNQWLHPGQKLLRADAEQQQCLVVLLHAVPFDFAHDQLP